MAFIDGSLDYDCASCPDNCCKGFGFGGMDDGPISDLIDNNPELLPWIQMRNKGYITCGTPISGCYFLESSGLCRIELTYGRSAKPGVCLLFPFNKLNLLDDHLVVRPHFLCSQFKPVVPPRSGFVHGSHRMVEEDIIITGMANGEVSKLSSNMDEEANAVLAAEKEFRYASEKALGTCTVTGTLKSLSQDAEDLSAFISRALKLLGINRPASSEPRGPFEDLIHVMLPVKRFDYLMLTEEGRLRAMLLASELARTSFNTAMMPTLNNLSSYFDTVSPLLTVLGLGEEPFKPLMNWWQDEGRRPPLDSTDQKIAFGTMILLSGKGYGTLQALEEALSTVSRPLERVLFIRRLATLFRKSVMQGSNNKEGKQPDKAK